ncbi:HAMP domain-containing sensor histidine kinase [Austwickia chelonae]|uniref:HAMP domain-containing sensor histidine kinase n=1 Tax=Austwickia chelonae TaxID=100225 RepID=UPI000E24B1DB|nr:HAMP domain-containing sensor histidine kinase [Austwickia chelonae]
MTLFWRLLAGNTLVAALVLAVLLFSPATISSPPQTHELLAGALTLAALIALNAWVIPVALRPLAELQRAMESTENSLNPSHVTVRRDDEIGRVSRSYNAMLDRLREERAHSASRAIQAQEEERVRIARELHDEVGQSLTAVLLTLGHAGATASREASADISEAQETVRAALDEVRAISARLRPGVLDDLGLVPALTALAGQTAKSGAICLTRELDDPGELDPTHELAIYRIAQEALTNVVRHAAATRVSLRLKITPEQVVLTVEDDGIGFDTRTASFGKSAHDQAGSCLDFPDSSGLRGMRERALLVGGHLHVDDLPDGAGASVVFVLPRTPRLPSNAADPGEQP